MGANSDGPLAFKYPDETKWSPEVQAELDELANAARAAGEAHQKSDTTTGEDPA